VSAIEWWGRSVGNGMMGSQCRQWNGGVAVSAMEWWGRSVRNGGITVFLSVFPFAASVFSALVFPFVVSYFQCCISVYSIYSQCFPV
jgi:hypothetical protein